MGRKEETRKAPGGSTCPVCQNRFNDQASLLSHIETCAASQAMSPLPPSRDAPAPNKARDLFRKISELATGQPQQPSAAPASGPTSAVFISGPTDVTHEAHASSSAGGMIATSGPVPVAKKRPPKMPAPQAPVKKELTQSRARSRSGGGGANSAVQHPEKKERRAAPRPRSVSVGSKVACFIL
jgi:hypothetical protein